MNLNLLKNSTLLLTAMLWLSTVATAQSTPPESKYCLTVHSVKDHKIYLSFRGTGKVWIDKGNGTINERTINPSWVKEDFTNYEGWYKIYADNLTGIKIQDNDYGDPDEDIRYIDFSKIPASLKEIHVYHSGSITAMSYNYMFYTLPDRYNESGNTFYISPNSTIAAGAKGCRTLIATTKGWAVRKNYNNGSGGEQHVADGSGVFPKANYAKKGCIGMVVKPHEDINVEFDAGGYPRYYLEIVPQGFVFLPVPTGKTTIRTTNPSVKIYADTRIFDCSGNGEKITSLEFKKGYDNITKPYRLEKVSTTNTKLERLDVGLAENLKELYCENSNLTSFFVINNKLKKLICRNSSKLEQLRFHSAYSLENLQCDHCAIRKIIGLNDLDKLKKANISYNKLTRIDDISHLDQLSSFNCSNNELISLEADHNEQLITLDCSRNKLEDLNVSNLENLESLYCGENELTELDVSNLTKLKKLFFYGTDIASMDLSGLNNLEFVDMTGCEKFTTHTLNKLFCSLPDAPGTDCKVLVSYEGRESNYAELQKSNAQIATDKGWHVYEDNGFAFEDFSTTGSYECGKPTSDMPYITLKVPSGQATNLRFAATEVNSPVWIETDYDSYVEVTADTSWSASASYTPSGNTLKIYGKIKKFDCSKIKNIKFSDGVNDYLRRLSCTSSDNLKNLDVTALTNLTHLYCYHNKLTELDVSALTNLTHLDFANTDIASIDLSGLNNLEYVEMGGCEKFTTHTLNQLFCSLPDASGAELLVSYEHQETNYAELKKSNAQIARDKGWGVSEDEGYGSYIGFSTTGDYECGTPFEGAPCITLTVEENATVKLAMAVDFWGATKPAWIETAPGVFTETIAKDFSDYSEYTAVGNTIKVYGELGMFACDSNFTKVKNIEFSENDTLLEYLNCVSNDLINLDLSNTPNIAILACRDNNLTHLDLNGLDSLFVLDCGNNQLTELNIAGKETLQIIACDRNNFSTYALDKIYCDLPEDNGVDTAMIYVANNTSDVNIDIVLATNAQNALDKKWKVVYADNGESGPLHDKAIPTTGSYVCGTILVEDVTVSPATTGIVVGNTKQLSAAVIPGNAVNTDVSWSSDNESVATVDANGLVTAVAEGKANIIVTTADGGYTDTCKVTVSTTAVAVTGVSVTPATTGIVAGKTKQLTATVLPTDATNTDITWSSDNEAVATVDANGLVTAVAEGTATITVTTADGGHTGTCKVTVTNTAVAVTGVSVTPETLTVKETETAQLTAVVAPVGATNTQVTWSSDNQAVATVDANGLVTAVAEGTAHIIVTTDEGNLTDTCTVTVTKESTGIQDLNATEVNLYPNPTNGQFFVEVPASGKLEITNLAGQKVQELALKAGKNEIYIKQPGLYFIYLTGKDYRTVKKLIVK